MPLSPAEHRRLLDKLLRELVRAEERATEHALREAQRNGEIEPVIALRRVAEHVAVARPRLEHALLAQGLPGIATRLPTSWSNVRWLAIDRMFGTSRHSATPTGADRAYRSALLDLRHAIDVARVLREAARLDELFALIRWCDDWLATRRALVADVEAQLRWFARQARPSAPA